MGGRLDLIVNNAFRVARRVRNETGIGQLAVSISYVAVELARKIFGDLKGLSILLIGAGKMSELGAKHLQNAGATQIQVTNRTYERAVDMARRFNGTALRSIACWRCSLKLTSSFPRRARRASS